MAEDKKPITYYSKQRGLLITPEFLKGEVTMTDRGLMRSGERHIEFTAIGASKFGQFTVQPEDPQYAEIVEYMDNRVKIVGDVMTPEEFNYEMQDKASIAEEARAASRQLQEANALIEQLRAENEKGQRRRAS